MIVTARGNLQDNVTAYTPTGMPDIAIRPIGILQRLAVKAALTYVESLLGVLGYGVLNSAVPNLPLGDFSNSLYGAALLAVAPTIINLLRNLSVILSKLDSQHPQLME